MLFRDSHLHWNSSQTSHPRSKFPWADCSHRGALTKTTCQNFLPTPLQSRLAFDKWHDDGRRRCLLHTQGDRFLNPAQVEHIVRVIQFHVGFVVVWDHPRRYTLMSKRCTAPPVGPSKTAAPPLLPTLQCSQLGRSPSSSRLHFNWIFNTPNHPRSGQDRV